MSSWAGALLLLTGAYSAYTQPSTANFQVTITAPTNGSSFTAPTNVQIDAVTFDTNDDVAYVVFVAMPGGSGPLPMYAINLGTVSNSVPVGGSGSHQELFAFTWTNVPVGTWALTAQAVGTNGLAGGETGSPPVLITVQPNGALYVDIASPANGATFIAPTTIQLIAGVTDSNGAIAEVQFFDGTNSLGIVTNGVVVDPPGSPGLTPGSLAYFLTWSNAPVGIQILTAVATDTNGQSAVSAPVEISVLSNYPPEFDVTITAPTNDSSFTAPTNLVIDAVTFDTNDDIAYVVFIATPCGSGPLPFPVPMFAINLGTVSNGVPVGGSGSQQELFAFTWTNALVGTWALTAVATDTNGQSVVSDPVEISVLSNYPPEFDVTITAPINGSSFTAPTNVQIDAVTYDTNDDVAYVVFCARPTGSGPLPQFVINLGTVSNGVPVGGSGSHQELFAFTWTNALVGTWALTAQAVCTNGLTGGETGSPPVVITVQPTSVISNFPAVVRITSPPNNAVFCAPVNIALLAYANDCGGSVSSVQFFAGTNSLGFGLPVLFAVPEPVSPGPVLPQPGVTNLPVLPVLPIWPIFPTNTFELIWSNPPPDSYVLTAVATFSTGDSATSAPVDITVVAQSPPPTNGPDVVNIVATDPIAIEGTNCWPWPGLPITYATPAWSNWVSPAALCVWFTNCGPKDATFTVRRCGETNDDLTVAYSIGGTASNGVDYVALPGTLDIPAGQMEAMITIVPIDNATNLDTNMAPTTVILSLNPSTNSPPDYFVGYPQSAEALIVDSESPQPLLMGAVPGDHTFLLTGTMLRDHTFCLSMNGPDGGWFRIDCSTNCLSWTPVCTNQVVAGSINFADPNAAHSAARWYRAVPLANRPSN
jgi:hypothetical protein